MEIEEFIIICVIASIIISQLILPPLIKTGQNIINLSIKIEQTIMNLSIKLYEVTYNFIRTFILNPITLTFFGTLITQFLIYIFYNKLSKNMKKEKLYKLYPELYEVEKFLKYDPNYSNYEELVEIYKKFQNPQRYKIPLQDYQKNIKIKLKEISEKLSERGDLENSIKGLQTQKEEAAEELQELNEELQELNEEIHQKQIKDQFKKEEIIQRLNIGYKEVFKASHLTSEEKEIAKEKDYHAINEYCVLENKMIPVLVQPPLNHSPTHTFLVWSVKKLLNKFSKIGNIIEHETRDADLTFKIMQKT